MLLGYREWNAYATGYRGGCGSIIGTNRGGGLNSNMYEYRRIIGCDFSLLYLNLING